MKSKLGILILGVLFAVNTRFVYSQSNTALAAGHSGTVSAVAYDPVKNYVLSAGMDGFLGIWDVSNNAAMDRFQVSPYAVRLMSLRPGKTHAALMESDGVGVHRISVWDYGRKENLFTLRFQDPIIFINYSAGGNFLMATRNGRTGVIFIHSETGEILDSPPDQRAISFAATGKSERTMMTYAVSGRISYWELNTGREIQNCTAPINLESPILVGNNRYLCGIDSRGLVVVDAVTGKEIARDPHAVRGALFPTAASDPAGPLEFMYRGILNNSPQAGAANLIHYTLGLQPATPQDNLERDRRSDSSMPLISCGAGIAGGAIALGTVDGGIWLLAADDAEGQAMHRLTLISISAAAVSGNSLALITGDTVNHGPQISIIPQDYRLVQNGTAITLEDSRNNTRISGDSGVAAGSPGRFIVWQTENTRSVPILINGAGAPERRDTVLERALFRHPLRSVSLLGNQALFLDTTGTITMVSTDSGAGTFTYTAADPLAVTFYDNRNIIIGQTAAANMAPFLLVNTLTQETTPFIYPAAAGAVLYRAPNGMVYGGVVEGSPERAVTSLLLLDIGRPSASRRLLEYPGEDTTCIIAQSGLSLATTMGGNGPTLLNNRGIIPFARSPSLPEDLIGNDTYFILRGKDGSISWYNPDNGSLLARLRLLEREWILEITDGSSSGPIAPRSLRGPVNRN
ncbi:hypothetical protein AGMMS49944_14720 [Spirochaetia bacterium]|nr:hypothetical protein AGMMS49944_14720 [Spirochaetia bacterium]